MYKKRNLSAAHPNIQIATLQADGAMTFASINHNGEVRHGCFFFYLFLQTCFDVPTCATYAHARVTCDVSDIHRRLNHLL